MRKAVRTCSNIDRLAICYRDDRSHASDWKLRAAASYSHNPRLRRCVTRRSVWLGYRVQGSMVGRASSGMQLDFSLLNQRSWIATLPLRHATLVCATISTLFLTLTSLTRRCSLPAPLTVWSAPQTTTSVSARTGQALARQRATNTNSTCSQRQPWSESLGIHLPMPGV